MRTYFASSVCALVLTKLFFAVASPIPLSGLVSHRSPNPDIDKNFSPIAPLVARSGRDHSAGDPPPALSTPSRTVPGAFLPPNKPIRLMIPTKEYAEDLHSLFNIVGLMRTAVTKNEEKKPTGAVLTDWIKILKNNYDFGGMRFSRGVPLLRPLFQGAKLVERKKMIWEAVANHNQGKWYIPTSEIEEEIKKVHSDWDTVKTENAKIPMTASLNTVHPQQQQSGEVAPSPPYLWTPFAISLPQRFLPDDQNLGMFIPKKMYPEGQISIINIAGLMRTALEGTGTARERTDETLFLNAWIKQLKECNSVGEMKFAPGSAAKGRTFLQGTQLMDRKRMIWDVVQAHNKGKWYIPSHGIEDEIKETHIEWDAVKEGNMKILRAASPDAAHVHQPTTLTAMYEFTGMPPLHHVRPVTEGAVPGLDSKGYFLTPSYPSNSFTSPPIVQGKPRPFAPVIKKTRQNPAMEHPIGSFSGPNSPSAMQAPAPLSPCSQLLELSNGHDDWLSNPMPQAFSGTSIMDSQIPHSASGIPASHDGSYFMGVAPNILPQGHRPVSVFPAEASSGPDPGFYGQDPSHFDNGGLKSVYHHPGEKEEAEEE